MDQASATDLGSVALLAQQNHQQPDAHKPVAGNAR
jgi:hypothetical protein